MKTDMRYDLHTVHLIVSGRVDLTTASQFSAAIDTLSISQESVKIIDCTELTYIGSCGLCSLLIAAQQEKNRQVKIILHGLSSEIVEMLVLCNIANLFDISSSMTECRSADAIQSCNTTEHLRQ